jgi:hypothetical protein
LAPASRNTTPLFDQRFSRSTEEINNVPDRNEVETGDTMRVARGRSTDRAAKWNASHNSEDATNNSFWWPCKQLAYLIITAVSVVILSGPNEPLAHAKENESNETISPSDPPETDSKPGRWTRFREDSVVGRNQSKPLTEKQKESMRQLEALGYLQGVSVAPSSSGVTTHFPDQTWQGLNFYVSGHAPEATLMNMDGTILHKWSYDYLQVFPGRKKPKWAWHWRRAHLYEDGDILALWEGNLLIRIDRNSRLKWKYSGKPHHDVFVREDGKIYVLARKAMIVPSIHKTEPVQDDFIDILDSHGNRLYRISVLECFQNSEYYWSVLQEVRDRVAYRLATGKKPPGDIFHANSIQVFDGTHKRLSPIFRDGNVLISLREPGIVAVIDPEQRAVVWATSGMWHRQHDPVLLDNGRMLIFDNLGHLGYSRVTEIDLFSQKVFWKFEGNPPETFYSRACGAVQRLQNGNTLITESENGRAFEVTPDGTVVWEFVNPHRAGNNNELIATLFEVFRTPDDWELSWLEN